MKLKLFILLVTTFFLTACEIKKNEGSVLTGKWITESCEQVVSTNGMIVDKWQKSIYEFTNSSNIFFGRESYSDSNCISSTETIFPTLVNDVLVTFGEIKETMLEEGIMGFSLNIKFKLENNTLSRTAFFRINSNKVCFSEAFIFSVFNFSISEAGLDAINFNQCLKRL